MSTWPSTLPDFRLPARITPQNDLLITQMDTGPAKIRRKFTARSSFFETSIQATGEQRNTLMNFYNGNIQFTKDDPTTGSVETFRFTEPPGSTVIRGSGNPLTQLWNITLRLERLP